MAGDLGFKVQFDTEEAAASFRRLWSEYQNGADDAADRVNRLLKGTVQKKVEVTLEVNKQTGARELVQTTRTVRKELDQVSSAYKRVISVERGSLTSIRQQLNKAKKDRDQLRRFGNTAEDAAGKFSFSGKQTEEFTRAADKVRNLELSLRQLQAAGGNAFDKLRVGLNLDNIVRAGDKLAEIVSIFQSLDIAVAAVTAPIRAATQALADLQSFALTFEAIGTGAAGATVALNDATRIALGLGIGIKTVREGFQQLSPVILNSGGSLSDVANITESLSSRFAAFGLSADKSRRVMNGIIQAFSKGKLMAEELTQQISEADPAFKTDLAGALKVSTKELEKMVKAGEITSQVLIEILPGLSKSSLLFGKLGTSATDAVDALEDGTVILSQVQTNIANISQLNLEKLAKIGEPIVISFLRVQAVVTDFLTRITQLESVSALVNVLSAVTTEAVRIADVFLRVAEGALIVLTPIAKLVNALLEIPFASNLIGLAIIGKLIAPLKSFGAALGTALGQQRIFGVESARIWSGLTSPIGKATAAVGELTRRIAASASGKQIDLFKDGQRDPAEISSAVGNISQASQKVSADIQKNFKKAFDSAKTEADQIKNELNELRRITDTGGFVPTGSTTGKTLKELRTEADALKASFIEVGPAVSGGIGQISKFKNQLTGLFGDVTNRVVLDKFKNTIADIRTTDPVRALGLLQAAMRELQFAAKDLSSDPKNITRFYNTKGIAEVRGLITSVAKDLKGAGTDIAGSIREISGSFDQFENSANQIGPAAKDGVRDVSKFKDELNKFGDVTDPRVLQAFKVSIRDIRTTDPVRALGLLRAAFDNVSREVAELPKKTPEWKKALNVRALDYLRETIGEVSKTFNTAGTAIPSSMEKVGKAADDVNDSFNKLNADKLLVVQSQVAEGESQIAGRALKLRDGLEDAQGRMNAAAVAAANLGSAIESNTAPALGAFSRETELIAKKRGLEGRLESIRISHKGMVASILRDARLAGKATIPGSVLSSDQREKALQKTGERGTDTQEKRVKALKDSFASAAAAAKPLQDELKDVDSELKNLKLNKDALAFFPKDFDRISGSVAGAGGSFRTFGRIFQTFKGGIGLGIGAVRGLAGAVFNLTALLGPLGVALLAVQVISAAWKEGTKGQSKALEEASVALKIYQDALKDVRNIKPETKGFNVFQTIWSDFSIGFVGLVEEAGRAGRDAEKVLNRLGKAVEDTERNLGGDKKGDVGGVDAKDVKLTAEQLRAQAGKAAAARAALAQFRAETTQAAASSVTLRDDVIRLSDSLIELAIAGKNDATSKARLVKGYKALEAGIKEQEGVINAYKKQLKDLRDIERANGKLSAEQRARYNLLNNALFVLATTLGISKEKLRELTNAFPDLAAEAERVQGSINGISEILKRAKENLENSVPNSKDWQNALADIAIIENRLKSLRAASEDPIEIDIVLAKRIKEIQKEIAKQENALQSLYEKLETAEGQAAIDAIGKEIDKVTEIIRKLKTNLEGATAAQREVRLKLTLDTETFKGELRKAQLELKKISVISNIDAGVSPEYRSSIEQIAGLVQQISDASSAYQAARLNFQNALKGGTANDVKTTGEALVIAGQNFEASAKGGAAQLNASAQVLRQQLEDLRISTVLLKTGNRKFLSGTAYTSALQDLDDEVQRLDSREDLQFRGGGRKAKEEFVQFGRQLEAQERQAEDLKKAIAALESAALNISTAFSGENAEKLSKFLKETEPAAKNAAPYLDAIQKSLLDGAKSASDLSTSLLSLDGKTIKVNIDTGPTGRWAGGPVSAGSLYRVNELGQEGFMSNSGKLSTINRSRNALWRPPSSGTVIPAHIMSRINAPRAGVGVSGANTSSTNNGFGMTSLVREIGKAVRGNNVSELRQEVGSTHAAQALEIGKLTRAVRDLVEKNWNVDVKVRNTGNAAYLSALNRMS